MRQPRYYSVHWSATPPFVRPKTEEALHDRTQKTSTMAQKPTSPKTVDYPPGCQRRPMRQRVALIEVDRR